MRTLVLLAVLAGCERAEDAPRIRQVPGGDPAQAAVAFERYGCGGCHIIPGIRRADGRVAPPLTDFGDRAYVAGTIPNNPENLVFWIMHPRRVHDRTAMPDLEVTEQDARDMAAYLFTLRSVHR